MRTQSEFSASPFIFAWPFVIWMEAASLLWQPGGLEKLEKELNLRDNDTRQRIDAAE